jgi:hypothetical protein
MQSKTEIGVVVDVKQARTGVRRRARKICAETMDIYWAEFAKVRQMRKDAEKLLAEAQEINAESRRQLDDLRGLHAQIFGGAIPPNQVKH